MIPQTKTILGLIGDQPYKEMMLVDNQDTSDIIEAILNKHEKCESDYDKFAFLFDGGSIPDICKRLYDYCRQNLTYSIEETKSQYTSKPATILQRGYSDCKCYSLFCGGVLDALKRQGTKVKWAFRFASYNLLRKRPYHVFIVVFYQGEEIFIDPVFQTFNYHKPAMWCEDYFMSNEPANVAGMVCDSGGRLSCLSDGESNMGRAATHHPSNPHQRPVFSPSHSGIGATTAGTGQQIIAVSSKLGVIPVVGWIAEAAGSIIGGAVAILGSKWTESTDVRWLQQLYEYYVLGNKNATSDNKVSTSVAEVQQAQAWFSVVLGVPIGGRKEFNILQSGNGDTNSPSGPVNPTQRANDYIAFKQLTGKIDPAIVEKAVWIANMMDPRTAAPGSWAGALAAPWTLTKDSSGSYDVTAVAPPVTSSGTSTLSTLFQNKWVLFGLIGAGLFLLTSNNKK
jgi:hypothetical protein